MRSSNPRLVEGSQYMDGMELCPALIRRQMRQLGYLNSGQDRGDSIRRTEEDGVTIAGDGRRYFAANISQKDPEGLIVGGLRV